MPVIGFSSILRGDKPRGAMFPLGEGAKANLSQMDAIMRHSGSSLIPECARESKRAGFNHPVPVVSTSPLQKHYLVFCDAIAMTTPLPLTRTRACLRVHTRL